ncbi:unnamed protein product [Debaryomyces tyrocola]|nr:unnamed protein product [Debaryomyces tyrocola]
MKVTMGLNVGRRRVLLYSVLFLTLLGLIWTVRDAGLDGNKVVDRVQGVYRSRLPISNFATNETLVIFPRGFELRASRDLTNYYRKHFNPDKNREFNSVTFNGPPSPLTEAVKHIDYHNHEISMYDTTKDISSDLNKCEPDINAKFKVDIGRARKHDDSLTKVVKRLAYQLENDDAMRELGSFFKGDLTKQIEEETVDQHWYKFAGTSVWLQQYGVHFMISRMLYSPTGKKNDPVMSLIFAQIYNERWEELDDVELIIPTVNPITNEKIYASLQFPSFLPIPFYHQSSYVNKRWYGPEDARILLVKNDDGLEEPLIVFNAYHRKVNKQENINEAASKVSHEFYRSMFMGWPFRFQHGKENVDGISNAATDDKIYNKVIELRREGAERLKVQKNWTPFISVKDRVDEGPDDSIYFVYRWQNLEILKCQLTDFTHDYAKCKFEYKRNEKLLPDEPVGALRGGTEMISLNKILPSINANLHPNKEVWIGFARAHLVRCGCGKDMYRPNLAVITREDNKFKISQLSSFFSLDIDVNGWSNPDVLCHPKEPNALIPNGISNWDVSTIKLGKKYVTEDFLTLSLSVADATVHTIQIKNLLQNVLSDTSALSHNQTLGYTNDVVECSLKTSNQFCNTYGQEQLKLGKVPV